MTSDQTASGRRAARLHQAIDGALQVFQGVDETRTTRPPDGGGWCARQLLGHLIDSACNNHRRFVLGQTAGLARFDGYNQDDWVDLQRYDKVPWGELVTLWTAYNRHLPHVMACVPDAAAERRAPGPDGKGDVSLGFLMDDYVTHLQHHVDDLRALLGR